MSAIAAGPGGEAWAIGTTPWTPGSPDKAIYQLVGGAWIQKPGGATEIAIDPSGIPYVINTGGSLFKWNGSNWAYVSSPGLSAIGVGSVESWGIGKTPWTPGSPDNAIFLSVSAGSWTTESGGALQVSVDRVNDTPWVVNTAGTVFRGPNWTATNVSGPALSWIGAGPTSLLWGIGTQPWTPGSPDDAIYASNDGANWVQQPGGARKVSVAPDGTPWIVNTAGTVFVGSNSPAPMTTSSACLDNSVNVGTASGTCGNPSGFALPSTYGTTAQCPDEWAVKIGTNPQMAFDVNLLAPNTSCANTEFALTVMGYLVSEDPRIVPRWAPLGTATSQGVGNASQCTSSSVHVPLSYPYGIYPGNGGLAFEILEVAVVAQVTLGNAPVPANNVSVQVTPTTGCYPQ